jgi:hypothetical protein
MMIHKYLLQAGTSCLTAVEVFGTATVIILLDWLGNCGSW